MARSILITAVLAMLLSACNVFRNSLPSDAPAGVLTTDRTLYEPGDDLVLALTSTSAGTTGYNLCTSALERETGGGWEPVQENRVCTMELRTLSAGESATFTLTIPLDLASGTYRYITRIERMDETDERGAMQTIFSNPFRVQG